MTGLMIQANREVFDLADTDRMIEKLIFAAFNSDCNECTKAAFTVAPSLMSDTWRAAKKNHTNGSHQKTPFVVPTVSVILVMVAAPPTLR
ncbi:hypothetical protein B0H19DRAFT_1253573 [Mycena capillaripes]|nr:hypothetical protein B0H19DRAFT_1253573 [Mycena capillaripes]